MSIRLDFLGTGSGNYRGHARHTSSALLDGLLLDCGAGTTGRLHDLGRFDDVDAVLVSHLHADHIAGLFDLLLHTVIRGRDRPLTIVSPPGLSEVVGAAIAAGATVHDPADRYELRWVERMDPSLTVGRWAIHGVPLLHTLPNLGYRLVRDGLSVFYTGDTRSPHAGTEAPTDVVVHEATFSDDQRESAGRFGHSTGPEAAEFARAVGARRLFLTHLGDAPGLAERHEREARSVFADTVVANDADRFEL